MYLSCFSSMCWQITNVLKTVLSSHQESIVFVIFNSNGYINYFLFGNANGILEILITGPSVLPGFRNSGFLALEFSFFKVGSTFQYLLHLGLVLVNGNLLIVAWKIDLQC